MKHEKQAMPLPIIMTEGFRFFFLFSGLFALVSILAWLMILYMQSELFSFLLPQLAMSASAWHAHEMIYGYAVGVVAGFFLTAVPNWTKTPPAKAAYIGTIGMLWLSGRLVMWWSDLLPMQIVACVDLVFLPPLLLRLILQMRHAMQMHNLIFISLLGVLWISNLLCHLEWLGWTQDTAQTGLRAGLFTIGMMIFVIGGRVVPAFTRNALRRMDVSEEKLPQTHPMANKLALISTGLLTLALFFPLPDWAIGGLSLCAASANLWRFSGWKGLSVLSQPILWSLHLGYAMLILSYAIYGIALLTHFAFENAAIHLLAIGAIGCMTLAVMSRASLGHTGRALTVRPIVTIAYLLLPMAALVRALLPDLHPDLYDLWIYLSAALWLMAFAVFAKVYFPILTHPRIQKS
ncbi:MAG: NnrS family protein [Cohaesibacter sp.]|nr:NnrS family protein [Cohaesibacter sp.]